MDDATLHFRIGLFYPGVSVLYHTGDNILTAVNVARSCRMVRSDEKVIFVIATPHSAESVPSLRFSIEDGGTAAAAQSPTNHINQASL